MVNGRGASRRKRATVQVLARRLRAVTDGSVRTAKRRRQGRGSSRGQMQMQDSWHRVALMGRCVSLRRQCRSTGVGQMQRTAGHVGAGGTAVTVGEHVFGCLDLTFARWSRLVAVRYAASQGLRRTLHDQMTYFHAPRRCESKVYTYLPLPTAHRPPRTLLAVAVRAPGSASPPGPAGTPRSIG